MSPGNTHCFEQFLAFAHDLADRSGATILPYFRAAAAIEDKADNGAFDPVTAADRAAEELIRDAVAESWPAHAVLGEEFGLQPGSGGESGYCWIVDPIDGTRSFIAGVPLWGTLIGLNHTDTPLLGMMNQPFTGERFWAGGNAAWYRGPGGEKPLITRACTKLEAAVLLATAPEMFAGEERERFEALTSRVRLRRFGTDCYGYCMLAAGQADLVVESGLAPYDIAPLIPVVERAGGRVTTWDGGPATGGGRIVAAGDPALHAAALEILAG